MRHFNVRILASTNVPFRPTTVQIPNRALMDYSVPQTSDSALKVRPGLKNYLLHFVRNIPMYVQNAVMSQVYSKLGQST